MHATYGCVGRTLPHPRTITAGRSLRTARPQRRYTGGDPGHAVSTSWPSHPRLGQRPYLRTGRTPRPGAGLAAAKTPVTG